jgi:hypothetical protein
MIFIQTKLKGVCNQDLAARGLARLFRTGLLST